MANTDLPYREKRPAGARLGGRTALPPCGAVRTDNIRLGILYMLVSVMLFSTQNAIGKWLAQSYPIPMLVFFRSFVALVRPSDAGSIVGVAAALTTAICRALGTLTVRDLTRTDSTASIVFYTAVFMALLAAPFLPVGKAQ